jgi:hypothetical protein
MALQSKAILATQAARPLHHWSDASLERARQTLQRVGAEWCARWQLSVGEVVVVNACEDAALVASSAWPWTSTGSAWLSAGPDAGDSAMKALLFGRDRPGPAPASSISQDLAAEALVDLLRSVAQLSASADKRPHRGDEAPPAADARRWSGAIRVRMDFARDDLQQSWHLHCGEVLASVLCGGVQRGAAGARPALAPVASALSARTLDFKVCLDDTTLTLGTLQSLHVGDVLPLAHRLDQPLRVIAPDASFFCAAYLGSRGQHRAVELVPAVSASPEIDS